MRSILPLLGLSLLLPLLAGEPPRPAALSPGQDPVDFLREVRPLLASRCFGCHGDEKQKGRLRLDRRASVFGERDGYRIVVPGDPTASELYARISLPPEDFDVMPPEEPFLEEDQVELLRRWIEEGAAWEQPDPPSGPEEARPSVPELSDRQRAAAQAAAAAIEARGGRVRPIAAGAAALEASLARLAEPAGDADLELLSGLAPGLVWLDLGGTAVTDAGLGRLAGLTQLRRLGLQRTAVGDAGLAALRGLERLEVLNLYGTRVSDGGLEALAGLPALRRVYLWDTAVTSAGARRLAELSPGLTVELGSDLPEEERELDLAAVTRLLTSRCHACHGSDATRRKAELRLDTFAGATAAREGGAAVVPGDPERSLLLQRVTHADEEVRMPPARVAERLVEPEVELLRRWIAAGAPYPGE